MKDPDKHQKLRLLLSQGPTMVAVQQQAFVEQRLDELVRITKGASDEARELTAEESERLRTQAQHEVATWWAAARTKAAATMRTMAAQKKRRHRLVWLAGGASALVAVIVVILLFLRAAR